QHGRHCTKKQYFVHCSLLALTHPSLSMPPAFDGPQLHAIRWPHLWPIAIATARRIPCRTPAQCDKKASTDMSDRYVIPPPPQAALAVKGSSEKFPVRRIW